MRKLSLLFIILMILLLILAVVPAVASSPPLDVVFEVEENLAPTADPFFASGPAVDTGPICDSGTTIDLSVKGQPGKNLQVIKEFTCDDGSGSFLVKLQVKFDEEGPTLTHFNWNIVGGTDAYVSLHGNGSGVGLPPLGSYFIFDIYDGKVH